MATGMARAERAPGIGPALLACVSGQGSASHPWFGNDLLLRGPDCARNLADAVHLLAALHGRHPGIVDLAGARTVEPAARGWLTGATQAMAAERRFLAALAAAAGPIPGTPGGGLGEAAVQGQRSALATLASSERRGCALGAALAFAIDWSPVRTVLDFAAERFGVEQPRCRLGDPDELAGLAERAAAEARIERALLFGAEQIAVQHRGLWDLLEARAEARREL